MIKIDEHYSIETDAYNYTLKYEKPTGVINEKTGKEAVSRSEWYYPSLESALRKYKDESLKDSNTLEEVWSKLRELEKTIRRVSRVTNN